MDNVTIPAEQVIPMDAIDRGVQGLRIAFVNVFAVAWRRRIDAHRCRRAFRARGLADKWNAPIFAHPIQFPYLTGGAKLSVSERWRGWRTHVAPLSDVPSQSHRSWCAIARFAAWRPPSDGIAEMPEWEILHTPGHVHGPLVWQAQRFHRGFGTLIRPNTVLTVPPDEDLAERANQSGNAVLGDEMGVPYPVRESGGSPEGGIQALLYLFRRQTVFRRAVRAAESPKEGKTMLRAMSLFSQLLQRFPSLEFGALAKKRNAERGAKDFSCRTQLVAILFCQLAHADSLREICNGLACCVGKLVHLGIRTAPNKSSLAYANRQRPAELYKELFSTALGRFREEKGLGSP